MEINGIKIRDMKDVRDVLMALQTITSGIENLSDDMNKNYTNYSSLNEDISNSVTTQKELIHAITKLQINAVENAKNLQKVNENILASADNSIHKMRKYLIEIEQRIKNNYIDIVENIDIEKIKISVENQLAPQIQKMDNLNFELAKIIDTEEALENQMKKNQIEMEKSVQKFNKVQKFMNFYILGGAFFGGVFVGAVLLYFALRNLSII